MLPSKRRKLDLEDEKTDTAAADSSSKGDPKGKTTSLDAPISPPSRKSARKPATEGQQAPPQIARESVQTTETSGEVTTAEVRGPRAVPSPVQLIRISDLGASENVDTIGISDILGDPLIKECWAFNYCHDVEWLLTNFDEDVRGQIRLMIVHGSWRKENLTRIRIEEAVKRHSNVRAITAYMPDPFGTHHSKMFILIRHDDAAQVIIHTANLLPQDWRMCQAVWRSPLLPQRASAIPRPTSGAPPPFGTGERFQFDLISYLNAYGSKLKELSQAMCSYDFSAVKACLVASVPSHQDPANLDIHSKTLWGWPALRESVKQIPNLSDSDGYYVAQVSSIATLGINPTWLHDTLCKAMQGSQAGSSHLSSDSFSGNRPKLSIVFPTADEIRRSIDGYSCGRSIHMKLQTAANQKQLKYLMRHLCHWAGDQRRNDSADEHGVREAGRKRTGPHIKTYLRFTDAGMTRLDWGLITSANLSKQAWGTEGSAASGEVKISSFEIGVLFWPDMWKDDGRATRMSPVFKKDSPGQDRADGKNQSDGWDGIEVGWRMPYDLPLVPYAENERPWCQTEPHLQPDWRGGVWTG